MVIIKTEYCLLMLSLWACCHTDIVHEYSLTELLAVDSYTCYTTITFKAQFTNEEKSVSAHLLCKNMQRCKTFDSIIRKSIHSCIFIVILDSESFILQCSVCRSSFKPTQEFHWSVFQCNLFFILPTQITDFVPQFWSLCHLFSKAVPIISNEQWITTLRWIFEHNATMRQHFESNFLLDMDHY